MNTTTHCQQCDNTAVYAITYNAGINPNTNTLMDPYTNFVHQTETMRDLACVRHFDQLREEANFYNTDKRDPAVAVLTEGAMNAPASRYVFADAATMTGLLAQLIIPVCLIIAFGVTVPTIIVCAAAAAGISWMLTHRFQVIALEKLAKNSEEEVRAAVKEAHLEAARMREQMRIDHEQWKSQYRLAETNGHDISKVH